MTFSTRPSYPGIGRWSNRARRALLVPLAASLVCCQQAAPVKPTTSAPKATATPLAACPPAAASPAPQVLLKNLSGPDDLFFDSAGRLLFSEVNKGTVSALTQDGSVQQLAAGLLEPEGIVVQADGRLLIAEQGRNRIVAIDPSSHAISTWRVFSNRTTNAGIDGIGPILPELDSNAPPLANGNDVIVPDSPNGLVWAVTPDGKQATKIASGLSRPVGAAMDEGGRIFVADEAGVLWLLDPAPHRFAALATPDDVVASRDGHLFVNTLGDNSIHELDASGHQVTVFASIQQPQGIALDGADNLYYTEAGTGRIKRLARTFFLEPPKVTRTGKNRFVICPVIARAAGFTDPLGLQTGSSKSTSVLRLLQPGTSSSGALEVETSEESLVITVTDSKLGSTYSLSQPVTLPH